MDVPAVLVHPEHKSVIPLAPEPIVKGDGCTKNDCERNASKRLLMDLRREHPHLKVLIVEDGLAANFPHLSLLNSLNMDYKEQPNLFVHWRAGMQGAFA